MYKSHTHTYTHGQLFNVNLTIWSRDLTRIVIINDANVRIVCFPIYDHTITIMPVDILKVNRPLSSLINRTYDLVFHMEV